MLLERKFNAPPTLSNAEDKPLKKSSGFSFHRNKRRLHQTLTIVLLTYVVLTRNPGSIYEYTEPQVVSNVVLPKEPREAKLGDGCYHVFLDVGANIGVHGRFLLEPEKYPRSTSSVALFAKEYPGLDNRDVCVFAFEANPKHWPRLHNVSEAYAALGWRYHIVEAAVSDKDGTTTFYHQGQGDEKHNEWGFSGAKDLSGIYGKENSKGNYTEEVVTIRLSDWIKTHIGDRLVPEVPPSRKTSSDNNNSNNNNNNDSDNNNSNDNNNDNNNNNGAAEEITPPILGMKVDIEGYEYVVIPDLIHSGAACLFTFIFGEYHPRFAPIEMFRKEEDKPSDNNKNNNDKNSGFDSYHRVSLKTQKELEEYEWALTTTMTAARNCKVRWINSDDESYLYDPPPLP